MHENQEPPQLPDVTKKPDAIYRPPTERIDTLKYEPGKIRQMVNKALGLREVIFKNKRGETVIKTEKVAPISESAAVVDPEATALPVPTEATPAEVASTVEVPPEKKFQLNSDNLAAEVESGNLKRTSTGLIDGVALFGSTHAMANWREESSAPALGKDGIFSYNPRMNDWNAELHPKAEALAMNEMSVLAMRMENKDIIDGSLGSMVEMGMACLSAALKGQKVVVSFEKDLEKTLQNPGALAQYVAMREDLQEAADAFPELITVLDGDDMGQFNSAIREAVLQQREKETANASMHKEAFDHHETLKKQRFTSPTPIDVFGGSSGAFSKNPDVVESFNAEQDRIKSAFPDIYALNKYPATANWDYAEQLPPEKKALGYRTAFKAEKGLKTDARVLVWSIQDEAVSQAAITELGFMLLKALKSGQQMMVVMEPFNAELYTQHVFKDKLTQLIGQVDAVDKTSFSAEQVAATQQLITDIQNSDAENEVQNLAKRIRGDKIIGKTEMFRNFDNARRTRAVFEAQIAKMFASLEERKNEIGEPFFTLATSVDQYQQQAAQIKAKYMPAAPAPLPVAA